jgi:hypothetical protein
MNDERIEAMARAIHDAEMSMFDSPTWLRRRAQAADAWVAADVEGMVRAGVIQAMHHGASSEMIYDGAAIDAIVAGVTQGAKT